jgi:hypothetical protein
MTDLEKLNFFDGGIEGVQLLAAKLDRPLRTAGATRTGTLRPRPSAAHERGEMEPRCTWWEAPGFAARMAI